MTQLRIWLLLALQSAMLRRDQVRHVRTIIEVAPFKLLALVKGGQRQALSIESERS